MENLVLDSLEIKNFRPFRDLQIEKLGRVNLIVGKNSVGKSSLLEAVYLYANEGSIRAINQILDTRNEASLISRYPQKGSLEKTDAAYKYMFFGRANLNTLPNPIQIGSLHNPKNQLFLTVGWYEDRVDEEGVVIRLQPLNTGSYTNVENAILGLAIDFNSQPQRRVRLGENKRKRFFENQFSILANTFIPTGGLDEDTLGQLWNTIIFTEYEKNVNEAMQVVLPGVERVAALSDNGPDTSHFIIVKLQNNDERVPLGSLGDGMHRVFGIALALVNCKDGILLVDEIENGLHYTTQLGLWRIIFKLAQKLNVQVFATTHSWDCIEAFQKAATEDEQSEGLLIRLENKDGNIVPTLFDEEDLAIVTKEQIEVR